MGDKIIWCLILKAHLYTVWGQLNTGFHTYSLNRDWKIAQSALKFQMLLLWKGIYIS